jgi:hypothetical protein
MHRRCRYFLRIGARVPPRKRIVRANNVINHSLIKITNARRLSLHAAVLRDVDVQRR